MKRALSLTLIVFCVVALFCSLIACNNNTIDNNDTNNDELYSKAMSILEELSDDQRVKDFLSAYDLLKTLPKDKDKLVSQLGEAYEIFEKYNVECRGEKYLKEGATSRLDPELFDRYRTEGASVDAVELLQAIVYPVLFERYGNDAQCINGITAEQIKTAIKSTNTYILDKKTENYDACVETWNYVGVPETEYRVRYHSNGLVESITIPIARSDDPFTEAELIAYFGKDPQTQKQIIGERFMSMSHSFDTIFEGYTVLSQIFTDQEITIISNYIHSLTLEDIWAKDLMSTGIEEPISYLGALVKFDYKGNAILINYSWDDITLDIQSKNQVNPLTNRWYTLWLGLDWYLDESARETYSDYINNNIAANDVVSEWSFDLDANADNFKESAFSRLEYFYENGKQLLNNGDYLKAADNFILAESYSDAKMMEKECYYQYAKKQIQLNYIDKATEYFSKCRGYKDTDEILLGYYYSEASLAVVDLMNSFSGASFTRTVDESYANATEKLILCEGYQDSNSLLEIVSKLYYAWDNMDEVSNYKASLIDMLASYSDNIVTITKSNFISGYSNDLSMTYNVQNHTFLAGFGTMSSPRYYKERTVILALIMLFTDIEDTADLDIALSNESEWTISGDQETFNMSYGGYIISIKAHPDDDYHNYCEISVIK